MSAADLPDIAQHASSTAMAGCKHCGGRLGRGNTSGYCRSHFARHAMPADHGERISRALKAKYAADPVAKAKIREIALANLRLPHSIEGRRRAANKIRLWEQGAPFARLPEARLKAAKTRRENALAWCPPELRDEYTRLNRRCHVPKIEAQRIILDQHEKNMRVFRRSIGG